MASLALLNTPRNSSCDVVFVHGLDGDAAASWGFDRDPSWRTWMTRDEPDWNLWTLSYEVPSSGWQHSNAMPLKERAINSLAEFQAHGLGQRPLFFVCHSMGGLLIKQVLRWAYLHSANYGSILDRALGVVFFSTPHQGARLADRMIKYLKFIYRTTQAVKDLKANTDELAELAKFYREIAPRQLIDTSVFYEGKDTLKNTKIVDAFSADPCIYGVDPVPFDADHYEICIPKSDADTRYRRTHMFIHRRLNLYRKWDLNFSAGHSFLLIGGAICQLTVDTELAGRVPMTLAADQSFYSTSVRPGDKVEMNLTVMHPDGSRREVKVLDEVTIATNYHFKKVKSVEGATVDGVGDGFPLRLAGGLSSSTCLDAGPVVDRKGHMRFRAKVDIASMMQFVRGCTAESL